MRVLNVGGKAEGEEYYEKGDVRLKSTKTTEIGIKNEYVILEKFRAEDGEYYLEVKDCHDTYLNRRLTIETAQKRNIEDPYTPSGAEVSESGIWLFRFRNVKGDYVFLPMVKDWFYDMWEYGSNENDSYPVYDNDGKYITGYKQAIKLPFSTIIRYLNEKVFGIELNVDYTLNLDRINTIYEDGCWNPKTEEYENRIK